MSGTELGPRNKMGFLGLSTTDFGTGSFVLGAGAGEIGTVLCPVRFSAASLASAH